VVCRRRGGADVRTCWTDRAGDGAGARLSTWRDLDCVMPATTPVSFMELARGADFALDAAVVDSMPAPRRRVTDDPAAALRYPSVRPLAFDHGAQMNC